MIHDVEDYAGLSAAATRPVRRIPRNGSRGRRRRVIVLSPQALAGLAATCPEGQAWSDELHRCYYVGGAEDPANAAAKPAVSTTTAGPTITARPKPASTAWHMPANALARLYAPIIAANQQARSQDPAQQAAAAAAWHAENVATQGMNIVASQEAAKAKSAEDKAKLEAARQAIREIPPPPGTTSYTPPPAAAAEAPPPPGTISYVPPPPTQTPTMTPPPPSGSTAPPPLYSPVTGGAPIIINTPPPLQQLQQPAGNLLPDTVKNALPDWLTNLPIWQIAAVIAAAAYFMTTQGKKKR